MKVFVSYAKENRQLAEQVAHSLRGRGHTVFFDRSSLPPGGNFEQQIEAAIDQSSLMVFLITENSVAAGRFTLTELRIAQKKWKSARNRVLPVMLQRTDLAVVPSYLRAVTILEPEGNAAAEIAHEVDRLAVKHRARLLRASAAVVAVAGVVALLWWYFLPSPPGPDIRVSVQGPDAHERGFFDDPDLYRISIALRNEGTVDARGVYLALDVEPEGSLVQREHGFGFIAEEAYDMGPGIDMDSYVLVSVNDGEEPTRWRICVYANNELSSCTAFENYLPKGELPYGDRFRVDESLVRDAAAVAWDGDAFLIADAGSRRLVRVDEDGVVRRTIALAGIPTAISVGSLGTFVGLTSPDRILRIDTGSGSVEAERSIDFPENRFGDTVSARPASMAQDGEHLWVIGRGGPSANGLGVLSADLLTLRVPGYYEDIAFDLPGMTLRNGVGAVWSGQRNVTPASIVRMTTEELWEFSGHEYDIAACASDVLPMESALVASDCDGAVYDVRYDSGRGRLGQEGRRGYVVGYGNAGNWREVAFGEAVGGTMIGVVTVSNPPNDFGRVVVATIDQVAEGETVLDAVGLKVVDLAVGRTTVMLIVEDDRGGQGVVTPGWN